MRWTIILAILLLAGCSEAPQEATDPEAQPLEPVPEPVTSTNVTVPPALAPPVCGIQTVSDPAGDVNGGPDPINEDLDRLDFLDAGMEATLDGLRMWFTVAQDPRGHDTAIYYWIGFEAEQALGGGNPPTWTFQGTTTYDTIRSMYFEDRHDIAVTWTNTTMEFTVPWDHFASEWSDWPIDIGSPRASSAGPYHEVATTWQEPIDHNDWATYDRNLVPMTC